MVLGDRLLWCRWNADGPRERGLNEKFFGKAARSILYHQRETKSVTVNSRLRPNGRVSRISFAGLGWDTQIADVVRTTHSAPLSKMELFLILVSLILVSPPKPALTLSVKTKLNPRIVQTRYGKIQGVTHTFDYPKYLHAVDVYLGIPYATPPIMSNRFSPTRAPKPWGGVK